MITKPTKKMSIQPKVKNGKPTFLREEDFNRFKIAVMGFDLLKFLEADNIYKAYINAGSFTNLKLQGFIDFPVNDTNLEFIDKNADCEFIISVGTDAKPFLFIREINRYE